MIGIFRVLFCVGWSIFWISLSLLIYLFTFRVSIPVAMARNIWAPGILWACRIRVAVEGLEHLDRNEPYIFVSNHQSYLDIPILFQSIIQNIYFVAKKELKLVPFLGWYMMATGMIFIDRSNRQKSIESLKRASELIHNGKSVLMFPEGTRSSPTQLGLFKKGPFMLARQARVEIVPVGIQAVDASFNLWKSSPVTIKVSLTSPVDCSSLPVNEVMDVVREKVSELSGKEMQVMV